MKCQYLVTFRYHVWLGLSLWLTLACAVAEADDRIKPIASWKLAGDTRDSAEQRHAVNHGADLQAAGPQGEAPGAARFDGRDDYLQIPAATAPRLGTQPFSISLWTRLEDNARDIPGCLVSQWDARQRRGFQFGISHHSGVTTNQANLRQVHFGIDQNRLEPEWTDHGQVGQAVLIFSLAVHDGRLYAGTCEPGIDQSGRVYRLDGQNRWVDCGSPHPCNSVSSLAVHDGQLYAGVSKYRLGGSALPESPNPHLGGKVFRYDGGTSWTDCGQLPEADAVGALVSFGGQLYASSLYRPAGFFRYDGGQKWTTLPTPEGKRVEALTVFNGQLFAGSYDQGHVFRYDGHAWTDCGQVGPADNTQTYSFAVHHGRLYVGTWRTGRVYRYEQDNVWTDVGRLGEELEVMGMLVHNGSLFAGSLPLAHVFRYESESDWQLVGRLDSTPDVMYRRAWTMAEYQGRLFCGTLPAGRVHSIQSGRCVTNDKALSSGWHHLVAVRDVDRLRLYVDGSLAATSAPFQADTFDLTVDQPWKIGFGATDYFHGRISDVRVYGAALPAGEVARLFAEKAESKQLQRD